MLSLKERMGLTRQASDLKSQIKGGQLPIGERIQKTRELAETIKKIKGTGPVTKDESEPVAEPKPDNQESLISVQEFSALSRSDQIAQFDKVLNAPNWYEYEMAYDPYIKPVEIGKNYVVYKSRYGYSFGYKGHISRGYDYWDKDAGSAKKNGGFGSWSQADRTKAKKTLSKHIEAGTEPLESENELIKKYKAGGFNTSAPAEFVEVMRDVHSEGLTLDEVKQGALAWLEANPDKMATAA